MKILIIGDVVGNPGRTALSGYLSRKKRDYDFVIVNGENSAAGKGITSAIAEEFLAWGVDVVTGGNHMWDKKEVYTYLDGTDRVLRPHNYPVGVPGIGYTIQKNSKGQKIAVISLQGRVFMNPVECPFRMGKELVEELRKETKFIIIDFHAEATSEKIALGKYLDGKASLLFGTHTHVQTADEKILMEGTGYISDIGMTGSDNGIIGTKAEPVISRFLTGLPAKFEVEDGNVRVNGISVVIDDETGECISIDRINVGEAEFKY
ncbi:MAG: TIGR00282 family metallophosphoesterase [Fusobacteriaceae bacterium]